MFARNVLNTWWVSEDASSDQDFPVQHSSRSNCNSSPQICKSKRAVTSEPDSGKSPGEMMMVFPVILSTLVAQKTENYHIYVLYGRGTERMWSTSTTGRWRRWEPCSSSSPQGLCVSVRGAGDGFRASEFLQMSSALAQQAAIASHVDVGSNC